MVVVVVTVAVVSVFALVDIFVVLVALFTVI